MPMTEDSNGAGSDELLGPEHATRESTRLFGPQLDALREIRLYARDLLKRAFLSSKDSGSLADLVAIAGLFRAALVGFDSLVVCAESGAADAAEMPARAVFEAELALYWLLDGSKEQRATAYYVGSLRKERRYAQMRIPGSPEQIQYAETWASTFKTQPPSDPDAEAAAQARVASIDRILARPKYSEVNSLFNHSASHAGDKPWYAIGVGGVPNYFQMTKALNREAEYIAYRLSSDTIHGSLASDHFSVDGDGSVSIEPVRYPPSVPQAVRHATFTFIRAVELVVKTYRVDELPNFFEHYRTWRPRLVFPHVSVTITKIAG